MAMASEVPVIQEMETFVIFEKARIEAMVEAQKAVGNEDRLKATLLATNLWTDQIDLMKEFAPEQIRKATPSSDADKARDWISAWSSETTEQLSHWSDFQDQLVAEVGRDRATELADGPVKVRFEAIRDEVRGVLEEKLDRLRKSAGEFASSAEAEVSSDQPMGETKICPDCAEEIKAAARKCRFCGFRYEEAPSS